MPGLTERMLDSIDWWQQNQNDWGERFRLLHYRSFLKKGKIDAIGYSRRSQYD